jgi:hypothetical protein
MIQATFTDVSAGTYNLYVESDTGFASADGTDNQLVVKLVADAAIIKSSIAGG